VAAIWRAREIKSHLKIWFKQDQLLINKTGTPGSGGYSLQWPIRGGSAQKGYLFLASGIKKGRDFTT